jgi:hypothetical protein
MTEAEDGASRGWTARHPWLANLALLLVTTAIAVAFLELALRLTGLFPPRYNYGDPVVGWRSANPSGTMVTDRCFDLANDRNVEFARNEDGVRTAVSSADLQADSARSVAVSGDSHTDLCAPNAEIHFGYLERDLRAAGLPITVYSYGAGKYSPLQSYLAVKAAMERYDSEAFVLNLYTGNDFMDLLRIDDRPHLVAEGEGYRIADPVWYQQDPPGLERRSRVLALVASLADATGVSRLAVRVEYLRDAAADQGKGMTDVIGYMNDLRKSGSASVGYSQAFTAQMLNQQLFFKRFAGSREESLRRLRFLLEHIRREQPDRVLVLSPIPSFQLVHPAPVDTALTTVLTRLPVTYEEGVREEQALFDATKAMAVDAGWVFVDNLTPLRAVRDSVKLYNTFDYHIEPVASEIIGRQEAEAMEQVLRFTARAPRPTAAPASPR